MASKKKRLERRKSIFGEHEGEVRPGDAVGWFKAPRTLPFILQLLREKDVVGSLDCDRVYLELLARDMGDGFIETGDEADHAFVGGYASGRGARSWRERVAKLAELGLVRTAPKMGREHGYLLLVDPEMAAERVFAAHPSLGELHKAFRIRRSEVGADGDDSAGAKTTTEVGTRVLAKVLAAKAARERGKAGD